MRQLRLGPTTLHVPAVAVGCMRINQLDRADAERYIRTAIDLGANFFDHADIYGNGGCEELFADAIGMNSTMRESVVLQSKCGVRNGRYDLGREYIVESLDKILRRLRTEYLDVLLLHRPDALMEPEQIAEAFEFLSTTGKVRHFGVSNFNPMQIRLLKNYLRQPIVANQMQLSIINASMISGGMNVNTPFPEAIDRDGSILDFCRLNEITIQAWSPFQYGFFDGIFLNNEHFAELNRKLEEIADRHQATKTTIALAWIMRHPANIQPIVGTMNRQRLVECCLAADIRLTHEEWYEIYISAGHKLP